ncbi:Fasciclin domain protein [compost metagenome]
MKIKNLALIVLFSVLAISCDDDNDTAPVDNSITGIASNTPDLSILVQALEKTELTTTLQASGSYTVFAPTNAAFSAFLATTPYATINDVPKAALTEILLNHVISTTLKSTDLTTGYIKTLAKGPASSTNTLSMYVNTASNMVVLNGGAMVSTADIMASNGVIHIVDEVIGLPTIVTHATANPNFTSLVGALTGAGQPDFVSILSGTGPFTVFAPTNDAFTALNTELAPGGIASVSAANLTKVLQYHVVGEANVLAATLTEGQIVTPILTPAQTFTIQLSGGAKIKDANNRISTIVATDVQCSNGVIHVLDKVLLPIL